MATTLALVLVVVAAVRFYPEILSAIGPGNAQVKALQRKNIAPVEQTMAPYSGVSINTPAMEVTVKNPQEKQIKNRKMPKMLGELILKEKRTIWWMLTDFYGNFNERQLKAVAIANPHIKNLNRIRAGEVIKLPAIPIQSNPLPPGKNLILIAKSDDIEQIYDLYKKYERTLPSLKFVSYWNTKDGMLFAIFMKDGYPDMESALNAAKKLPQPISSEAQVLSQLDDNTVFFTR